MALAGTAVLSPKSQRVRTATDTGETAGVTRRIAEFIVQTKYREQPQDIIDVGRKSIVGAIGLALEGSAAKSGQTVRAYLESLGVAGGDATVVGSALRSPARLASFANGIGIHTDCDDTQLPAAPDRVYGLLTHPTAPCLSAALAVAEARGASGRDFMLAYHRGVEVESKIAEAIAPPALPGRPIRPGPAALLRQKRRPEVV